MAINMTPAELARENRNLFRSDFPEWLETPEGIEIYGQFEVEALAVARRREHYAARTIVEVIRHNSLLRDAGPWKLNNNRTPCMARLFALRHPKYEHFFEFRDQEKRARRRGGFSSAPA